MLARKWIAHHVVRAPRGTLLTDQIKVPPQVRSFLPAASVTQGVEPSAASWLMHCTASFVWRSWKLACCFYLGFWRFGDLHVQIQHWLYHILDIEPLNWREMQGRGGRRRLKRRPGKLWVEPWCWMVLLAESLVVCIRWWYCDAFKDNCWRKFES